MMQMSRHGLLISRHKQSATENLEPTGRRPEKLLYRDGQIPKKHCRHLAAVIVVDRCNVDRCNKVQLHDAPEIKFVAIGTDRAAFAATRHPHSTLKPHCSC